MSETQAGIPTAEAKPPRKKPGPKPKIKIDSQAKPAPVAEPELSYGMAVCYVAIPNRVSRGNGTKADAGERLVGPAGTIKELRLRGLAYPSKETAHAAFLVYKEKRDIELEAAYEAEQIRAASKERAKRERLTALKGSEEWAG